MTKHTQVKITHWNEQKGYGFITPAAGAKQVFVHIRAFSNQQEPPQTQTSQFVCDGRIHCSQMTSCAEARYFIQNCPNTKMDGDRDGVPCESQWCE